MYLHLPHSKNLMFEFYKTIILRLKFYFTLRTGKTRKFEALVHNQQKHLIK